MERTLESVGALGPTGPAGQSAEPPLATVEKAIDVLFHLHSVGGARGVTAIGRALGLPKSSAHRLLAALLRRDLVERDERGRYRPGIGLVALGVGVLEREPVVAAARPVLEREAAALGETFFLVASRAGGLVVLDKAEGTGFLRAAPRVGSEVPVHATAVGKLHLAFAPELVRAATRSRATAFTAATLVDPRALELEVDEARRRGWARNCDEWIAGLSVIAAPVFSSGRFVATVALAGSSARVAELGAAALADQIKQTAAEIGQRLEGTAP